MVGEGEEEGVGWVEDTPEGRSVVLLQSPHRTGRVLGQAGQSAGGSPWHRADQLHRGDQLHQENLWGQQGQENRVHQQDPGWGSHSNNQGLKSGRAPSSSWAMGVGAVRGTGGGGKVKLS